MTILGIARLIAFGIVEEVDAGVIGGGHQLLGVAGIDLLGEGDPGPERELADLQARFTKTTIVHGALQMNCCCLPTGWQAAKVRRCGRRIRRPA
jgi:hypothetical protein